MKKVKKDWTGHTNGLLTVVKYSHKDHKDHYWECVCECGNTTRVRARCLCKTQSCGCLSKTHGLHGTPTYTSWKAMHARVRSDNPLHAPHYKDKGITVCSEWSDFIVFLKDMGERPSLLHSVDRKDLSGGYCKGNCKWSTQSEQQSNKTSPRNTSGRIGVSLCPSTGKWRARLNVGKKYIWLGRFDTFEAACVAMEVAELEYLGYSRKEGYIK